MGLILHPKISQNRPKYPQKRADTWSVGVSKFLFSLQHSVFRSTIYDMEVIWLNWSREYCLYQALRITTCRYNCVLIFCHVANISCSTRMKNRLNNFVVSFYPFCFYRCAIKNLFVMFIINITFYSVSQSDRQILLVSLEQKVIF